MATITKFEELEIWQLARTQAKEVFALTLQSQFAKDFELKDQIRRSSGSVMDNIAEAFEKFSNKEFCQSLIIAKGSNGEVRSQYYRSFDRGYINEDEMNEKLNKSKIIGSKIATFISYLQSSPMKTKRKPDEKQPPTSNIKPPTSNLELPTSNLQPPTSNLQPPTSA